MPTTTIISPGDTELSVIKDKIEMLADVVMVYIGDLFEIKTRKVIFDLTIDLFDPHLDSAYLYRIFAELQKPLSNIRYLDAELILFHSYPFTTNIKNLIFFRRILDQFVELLIEFYNAKLFFVPTIISRYGFKRLNNPLIEMIDRIRMGKGKRINISDRSRFIIIYDSDIVQTIMRLISYSGQDNLIIEGMEISLKDIYERSIDAAGFAPIQFDRERFLNFHYPQVNAVTIDEINYRFENMMVDIVQNLF